MPSRKDRFGRLGGPSADARGSGQTADLFEHYGIPLDPADSVDSAPDDGMTAVAAKPCRRCGWFLALDNATACPLCGEAKPHAQPPKAAKS
jgi:hypothetical protein